MIAKGVWKIQQCYSYRLIVIIKLQLYRLKIENIVSVLHKRKIETKVWPHRISSKNGPIMIVCHAWGHVLHAQVVTSFLPGLNN